MSYVAKTLAPGERILHEARFHWTDKFGALLLCPLLIGIFWAIRMWSTEMAITNHRLIYKRGWIARRTQEVDVARTEEIGLVQGVMGRILGYGRIYVQGLGIGRIDLPKMANPVEFRRQLQNAQAQQAGGSYDH